MNLNILKILFTLLLIFSLTSISAQQINPSSTISDTITIASEPDYPPYCFVDTNGEAAGFSIDLFQAAAQAVGLQVKMKVGVWNVIKQDLAEGRLDALPLVGRTPEREEYYDFTMPYISLHGAVFVQKGTKDINSLADLKNKSIVVMKGDNAEEFVRRENISDEIATTNTFEEAFTAVAAGNHDAVITQRIMGIELLKELGIKNVIPLDFHLPEFRQDFCFAVQKDNTQLQAKLNEGLSIIIANDTYERIRYHWFGPEIKTGLSWQELLRYGLMIFFALLLLIGSMAIVILRREVRRQTANLKKEIEERKNAMIALQASEDKFRNMIMNLMEGFYSVTPDGNLLDHNREFCRILKLDTNKDHTGIKLPDFWQDPHDREIYLEELLENGNIRNYEIKAKKADGEKMTIMASSRLIQDEEGNPIRIEGTFLDITDRKHAVDELNKIKNKLEETVKERTAELEEKIQKLDKSERAMLYMVEDLNNITAELKEERRKLQLSNQELEAFTYTVSHDLRAPLRAIDGYSKFLLEDYGDKLEAEGIRYLSVIRESSNRMDQLITDLLSLSRVSRADMNIIKIDMKALIIAVYQEVASPEEKREFTFKSGKFPLIMGDPSLLKQVWQNLIDNALKYSAKSEIKHIEVTAKEDNTEIIFCIKDQGTGFNNKYKDKLFGVFQRLHNEEEFEGTGVGLAIVKRIIHRHGGRVWAEGKSDQGAAFYFSLPLKSN